MARNDLTGRRFGHLTVTGDSGERDAGGSVLWRCRCDCGGETLARRYQLEGGGMASCGCVPRPRAPRLRAEDLAGQRFGSLTALRRAENDGGNRARWVCRCDCGREVTVQAAQLKSGRTRSCGCMRHERAHNRLDLTGRRFGRLTALCPAGKKGGAGKLYWHCRCDCGNEVDVMAGSLLRGLTRSCGCLSREQGAKMHGHMHYQDGTCAEVLKRIRADTGSRKSKAGFRGLFLLPSGKYRASITFQGKHYNLGHYSAFADAVRARLDAEEALHAGYLSALDSYERKARENPGWARENPFYYTVTRVDGEFKVSTN